MSREQVSIHVTYDLIGEVTTEPDANGDYSIWCGHNGCVYTGYDGFKSAAIARLSEHTRNCHAERQPLRLDADEITK